MGPVAATEAPMGAVEEKFDPKVYEAGLVAATDISLAAIKEVLTRIAKDGKDAKLSKEEAKELGSALGWILIVVAGTENDPSNVTEEDLVKLLKKEGGGKKKYRGGVVIPVAAWIMGAIAALMAAMNGNQIYQLNNQRALVRAQADAILDNVCPDNVLRGIKPTATPGLFGYVNPMQVADLQTFNDQSLYCTRAQENANTRIAAAETAFSNAINRIPHTIGAMGSAVAIAAGQPVGTVVAIQGVATLLIEGTIPSGQQLVTIVNGLNAISVPRAAAGTGASAAAGTGASAAAGTGAAGTGASAAPKGGRRKTRGKKSKRRATQRTIRFAY